MDKKNRILLLVILILLLYKSVLSNEQELYQHSLSIFGNYSAGLSKGSFSIYESLSQNYKDFNNGNFSGYEFGVGYIHILSKSLGLGCDAGFLSNYTTFGKTELTEVSLNGNIETGEFNFLFINDAKFTFIRPKFSWIPFDNFQVGVSYRYSIPISNQISFDKSISKPSWARFIDENGINTNKKRIIEIVDSNNASAFSSLMLGFSYKLPLNNIRTFELIPELNINYTIKEEYGNYSWNTLSMQIGLRIAWNFANPTTKQIEKSKINNIEMENKKDGGSLAPQIHNSSSDKIEIDTSNEITDSNIYSVHINDSLNPTDKKSRLEKIDNQSNKTPTHIIPLINRIYFNKNSSDVKDEYLKYKTNREIYSSDILTFLIDVHYSVLDTLSYRLSKTNDGIELVGVYIANIQESKKIANRRVKELRKILIELFNIDSSRISISLKKLKRTRKPVEEFDYVEIKCNNKEILSNIILKKKENYRNISDSIVLYYFFDFDEKIPSFIPVLDRNTSKISNTNNIIIEGFSDNHGDFNYNKRLSLNRGISVSELYPNKSEVYGKGILTYDIEMLPENRVFSRVVRVTISKNK